jgi:hypothetical protein
VCRSLGLRVGADDVKNNCELHYDLTVRLSECGEELSCSVQGVQLSKSVHCTNCTKEVMFR